MQVLVQGALPMIGFRQDVLQLPLAIREFAAARIARPSNAGG
jgi:hypothetical protein